MLQIERDYTFQIRPRRSAPLRAQATVARQAQGTTTRNTLNVYSPQVLLEVEGAYFHHGSAVMMPDTLPVSGGGETEASHFEDASLMTPVKRFRRSVYNDFKSTPFEPEAGPPEQDRVAGLGILAVTYRFLALNPAYQLLIAGHTDTSGEVDYNFYLSDLRARNVMHLLLGKRADWVDICQERSKVEDRQRILKHINRTLGWDVDPGEIDNQDGEQTQSALTRFQQRYNQEFSQSIAVDGLIGAQTWGAVFDVYMKELASMLGTTADELAQHRSQVRFLRDDNRYIACGEKLPIDAPERDNYRSQENRRVEMLFFRPPYLPDLSCHKGTNPYCMKSCDRGECGVYVPGVWDYIFLEPEMLEPVPPPGSYQDHFEILETEADLTEVADGPDAEYAIELELHEVPSGDDPETAWAFLEPFAETDPGVPDGQGGTGLT